MKYRQIVQSLLSEPWALYPPKMAEICSFLAVKAQGGEIDPETAAKMAEAAKSRARESVRELENVAVIPVLGTILHRGNSLTDSSGIASTKSIRRELRAAMADEQVRAIVFDIDSPGGSVYGTAELAAEIRKAKAKKPVYASVNGMAASAAYYLASQATRVFMSPSSEVGSIGVIIAHEDWSKALEDEGVKVTLVTAGKYKAENSPYAPLSKEAREGMEEAAEDFYRSFLGDVAKGRNTAATRVKTDFGEGRLVRAQKALEVGMVDRIGSLDDAIIEAMAEIMLAKRASLEEPIGTVRQYEEFLHNSGKFTKQQAIALASVAAGIFSRRDSGEDDTAPNRGDPETEESRRDSGEPTKQPLAQADYLSALKKLI